MQLVSQINKISKQEVLRTKLARKKFHEQNQFTEEISQQEEKSRWNKFHEQQSASKKFHGQNQFHNEKSQCKSFMKRKINIKRVS